MKTVVALLTFVIIFLIAYLAGSFYSAEFNIALWTPTTRFFVLMLGGWISVLVFVTTRGEGVL